MSCCFGGKPDETSRDAKSNSRRIDNNIKNDKRNLAQNQEVKLLLLGAGESGKSTVLKQMKVILDDGFSEEDRKRFVPAVYSHIISSIRSIVQAMVKLGLPLSDEMLKEDFDYILSLSGNARWSEKICDVTKRLWDDENVKSCWNRANEYQVNDNADYFFNMLDTVLKPDFIPTEQDIFRTRIQTTGIFESKFNVGQLIFHMVDVGGQRSERRKWLLCFSDVTAVVFIIAISSYDQRLREDAKTNRLKEALNLFSQIWNNRYLRNVSVILLLNKIDIFVKKLNTNALQDYFHEYTGGNSYMEASAFVQNLFVDLANREPLEGKQVYPHFICAIDTKIVQVVLKDIKNIILNMNLKRYGFV